MKCPLCNVEMRIVKIRNVVENDDTPDKPTKLFVEQDLTCMNKECSNFKKITETVKSELPIG